jgi:hypothetical protein
VLPSSLLLQRKEDRQGTETDESTVKEMHTAERQTYHLPSDTYQIPNQGYQSEFGTPWLA